MGDGGGGVPSPYNVSGVTYEESPSKPLSVNAKNHVSAESGSVVVRYRIFSDLTWKRWIPLYKSGLNIVRIEYTVGHASGGGTHCGYWQEETILTVKGLCSASKYERILREAALKRMKKHLDPQFNIYKPNTPAPEAISDLRQPLEP